MRSARRSLTTILTRNIARLAGSAAPRDRRDLGRLIGTRARACAFQRALRAHRPFPGRINAPADPDDVIDMPPAWAPHRLDMPGAPVPHRLDRAPTPAE